MSISTDSEEDISLAELQKRVLNAKTASEPSNSKENEVKVDKFARIITESRKRKFDEKLKKKKKTNKKIKPKVKTSVKSTKSNGSGKVTPKAKKQQSSKKVITVNQSSYGIDMTAKHMLVHSILKRWNYCLPPWPPVEDVKIDDGYIETGFKGIVAGYRGEVCGDIKDTRSRTRLMPSLRNLLKIDCSELKDLLIEGIKKQKEDLIQFKHLNSADIFVNLCKSLDKELKEAEKINSKKMEKDFLALKYIS